jgi:hypothetical protein
MEKEKKVSCEPPGWIVTWFDKVKLDQDRAVAFDAFRKRLCQVGGNHNPALTSNNLWMIALDLLLEHEIVLIAQLNSEKQHERAEQGSGAEDQRAPEDG